jgi:hypothetical protein
MSHTKLCWNSNSQLSHCRTCFFIESASTETSCVLRRAALDVLLDAVSALLALKADYLIFYS